MSSNARRVIIRVLEESFLKKSTAHETTKVILVATRGNEQAKAFSSAL